MCFLQWSYSVKRYECIANFIESFVFFFFSSDNVIEMNQSVSFGHNIHGHWLRVDFPKTVYGNC